MPDTAYTARFEIPDLIERGRDNLLKCWTYHNGTLSEPSSGTVSIYDASNTAIVSAAAVTIAGAPPKTAQYNLTAATLSGLSLEEGWRVEWALTMADGVVHTFRNDAALVRARLYPVVTDADLFRRHPDFDPADAASVAVAGINYQEYIDEAWIEIQQQLIARGNRPNLVMSPSSLRFVHLYAVLELVCRHFSSTAGDGSRWAELAEVYGQKTAAAWAGLNFLYDTDDDGQADDPQSRRTGHASIWLGSGAR